MTIKVGDIIRYKGIVQRLMMCGTHIFRLSHHGSIRDSYHNLESVESVTLPNLEVGDWVIVNNIPIEEKNLYLTPWYGGCEQIVTSGEVHQITEICDTVLYGQVVKIDSCWFLPYHLTPTNGYDII